MNDNEKEKAIFSEIMLGIAENFSARMSSPGLQLRFMALKNYSLQQIEAAALKILTNRTAMGMPTVAEFLVAMNGDQRACDNAEGQVKEVMERIRNTGSYGYPDFHDPVTAELLKSRWSWMSLCAMTEAELKWWARDFIEAYQASERKTECLAIGNGDVPRKLKLLTGGIGN
jgi:hypothetical protein